MKRKTDSMRWVWVALLLGLIIPLGFDTDLVIPIKYYTLRINYIAHAITFICFVVLGWKNLYALNYISFFKKNRELWCFLGMGLTGIVSLLSSENLTRSVFFWVWSIGTLLTMKYVVTGLKDRLGLLPLRILCFYWLIYSTIVIWDFTLCSMGRCGLKIGRVFNDWRPHGWYYEPSYFAGMGLYMILCFCTWSRLEKNSKFSKVAISGIFFSGVAVLFSTSRLGLLGIGVLFVFSFVFLLRQRKKLRLFGSRNLLLVSVVVVTLISFSPVPKYLISGLSGGFDGSRSERIAGAGANWAVFKGHPWFGVGPGAAGAFFVHNVEGHPYHEFLQKKYNANTLSVMKEKGRSGGDSAENDPLGHSVWLEILSEWGLVGFLFFFSGILIMLFSQKNTFFFTAVLAIAFSNNLLAQTLPRYDLWFALSILVVFSNNLSDQHLFKANPQS